MAPPAAFNDATSLIAALSLLSASAAALYLFVILPLPPPRPSSSPFTLFSEQRAWQHVVDLTAIGPHEFGSPQLEEATKLVVSELQSLQQYFNSPSSRVQIDLDVQEAKGGHVDLHRGSLFKRGSVVYGSTTNVVVRVSPKAGQLPCQQCSAADVAGEPSGGDASGHREDVGSGEGSVGQCRVSDDFSTSPPSHEWNSSACSFLVTTHIDTAMSGPGSGDSSSNVAVMLELVRNVAAAMAAEQLGEEGEGEEAKLLKFLNSIIFLFNTGEEEGLVGAHAFYQQHPWMSSVASFVDLEAIGIGGKSSIFQAGPSPWLLEVFRTAAPRPSGLIAAQDLFLSGVINAGTDFQVFQQMAGLSGLDFAFTANTAVYHTKFDHISHLTPGSLQHLGDNLLPFLLSLAASPALANQTLNRPPHSKPAFETVYLDIMGLTLVTISQETAHCIYTAFAFIALFSLIPSFLLFPIPFLLTILSHLLSLFLSLVFASIPAFLLPLLSYSPIPYLSLPILTLPLFALPALSGALLGQFLGRCMLLSSLHCHPSLSPVPPLPSKLFPASPPPPPPPPVSPQEASDSLLSDTSAFWWLLLLCLGSLHSVGSTYLALLWLLPPLLAAALRCTLNVCSIFITSLLCLPPLLLSADPLIRLPLFFISSLVRVDATPGSLPAWLPNLIIAIIVALLVFFTSSSLLPHSHKNGASLLLSPLLLLPTILYLICLSSSLLPQPFSASTPRTLLTVNSFPDLRALNGTRFNWKQAAESAAESSQLLLPAGVLTVASFTPGSLEREAALLSTSAGDSRFDLRCFKAEGGGACGLATAAAGYCCTAKVKPFFAEATAEGRVAVADVAAHFDLIEDVGEGAVGVEEWRKQQRWWNGGKEPFVLQTGAKGGEGRETIRSLEVDGEGDGGEEYSQDEEGVMRAVVKRITRDSWMVAETPEGKRRLSFVKLHVGISSRWTVRIDSNRVAAFALHGIDNGEVTTYVNNKPTESSGDGSHFIFFKDGTVAKPSVRKDFILSLLWRNPSSSRAGMETQSPLLRLHADFQRGVVPTNGSMADGNIAKIMSILPLYYSRFAKLSVPCEYGIVDEL